MTPSNKLQRTPSVTVGMVTLDVHMFDGQSVRVRRIGIDEPEPLYWLVNGLIVREPGRKGNPTNRALATTQQEEPGIEYLRGA